MNKIWYTWLLNTYQVLTCLLLSNVGCILSHLLLFEVNTISSPLLQIKLLRHRIASAWCMRAQLCLTFATPWAVAHQAPPSVGYPRQEYWNGLPFPSPAAKSLQSCPTLCNPIDGSPPGSPVPGTLQARTLEWVAISFSNACKWKVKVKSLSRVWLWRLHGLQPTRLLNPWDFPGTSTGVGCHLPSPKWEQGMCFV